MRLYRRYSDTAFFFCFYHQNMVAMQSVFIIGSTCRNNVTALYLKQNRVPVYKHLLNSLKSIVNKLATAHVIVEPLIVKFAAPVRL